MFSIAYHKTTKKLIMARRDTATVGEVPQPQEHLEQYCSDNDLNTQDYIALEYPFDKKLQVTFGNHVYNESTGKIEADPNYVPPPPPEPITPPTN
jgi:hypothetical protein